MAGHWTEIISERVELGPEGDLELSSGSSVSREVSEQTMRLLLASLLRFARAPSPGLLAVSVKAADNEDSSFEAQLLSALVPLNEAAARRGLARLSRQTAKYLEEHKGAIAVPSRETPPPRSSSVGEPVVVKLQTNVSASPAPLRLAEQLLLFDENIVGTPPAFKPPQPACSVEDRRLEGLEPGEVSVDVDCSAWGIPSSRSDLRELIGGFLSDSISEDRMASDLRRSIGIED